MDSNTFFFVMLYGMEKGGEGRYITVLLSLDHIVVRDERPLIIFEINKNRKWRGQHRTRSISLETNPRYSSTVIDVEVRRHTR